jgi:predicted transcriptional regulator
MACISPDGKPTESGTKMLRALKAGLGTPEEIAGEAGLPLFRVRSGLRELTQAGLANQKDDKFELSSKGVELVGSLPT